MTTPQKYRKALERGETGRDEVRAVPLAILALGFVIFVVVIGLGILGGPLGFFTSAVAGGIFALIVTVCLGPRR